MSGHPITNIAVIAQSVGAVLAATWLHDYAPKVRCAVLASPAFKVKLYVPLARPCLGLLQKLRGNFFVKSYVRAKFLTHDRERIASFNADELITRDISPHDRTSRRGPRPLRQNRTTVARALPRSETARATSRRRGDRANHRCCYDRLVVSRK